MYVVFNRRNLKCKLIMIIFLQFIFVKVSIVLWRLKVWIVYMCKCEIFIFYFIYLFIYFVDSKSLSIFKKLETLNLNQNMFKNASLQQLNIFTSLKNLSLRWNSLEGFFPIEGMCNYYFFNGKILKVSTSLIFFSPSMVL